LTAKFRLTLPPSKHREANEAMRISNLSLFAAICAPLLSACAVPSAWQAANGEGAPCPSMEGYPDCQDGHRVDLARIAPDPQDRVRIQDLQARYELAAGSGDASASAALFTEDGIFEAPGDIAHGRAAIRQELTPSGATVSPVKAPHVVTNVVIRIDGDKATSTASWMEVDRPSPGHQVQVGAFGHYEDQFIKSGGNWLFTKRKVVTS
jgi:uncharacterized protein (TIGR02246 family)